mgnify:FL=1
MVRDNVLQIIQSNLSERIKFSSVSCDGLMRTLTYETYMQNCYIAISYEYIDQFYKIKIENNYGDHTSVVLLTKSKKFHKEIKKYLKAKKLSKREFSDHIYCFIIILKNILEANECVDFFEKEYVPDLKYDGIYL